MIWWALTSWTEGLALLLQLQLQLRLQRRLLDGYVCRCFPLWRFVLDQVDQIELSDHLHMFFPFWSIKWPFFLLLFFSLGHSLYVLITSFSSCCSPSGQSDDWVLSSLRTIVLLRGLENWADFLAHAFSVKGETQGYDWWSEGRCCCLVTRHRSYAVRCIRQSYVRWAVWLIAP